MGRQHSMSKPGPRHGRFDPSFDYLQLLGVDASDVSRLGPDDLDEVIKKKKKEWMGRALNPLYQQEAKSDLERARQFEELRRSPDALAAYLSHHRANRAARRQQDEVEIRQLVAAATAGKKELTPK